MIWRIVGLSVLVSLLGVASCADDEAPAEFTTAGSCAPDEFESCDCPGDEPGKRFCTASRLFGECACPGCTATPDCDECESCVERCMCETGRVHDESLCRNNCAALGELEGGTTPGPEPDSGDNGGSGGQPAAMCDPQTCPAATGFPLPGCCDAESRCGFDFQGQCIAANQPGTPDADCPPFTILTFELPGCCRPDDTCGVQDDFLGFGCLDPSALGGGSPLSCDPIR